MSILQVFNSLKAQHPQELSKLVAIRGDLQKDDLDLTIADFERLTNCSEIILHCAGTVASYADLRVAVHTNLCGTRSLLNVASSCPHLKVFVHVSSAFVHVGGKKEEPHLDEHFQSLPFDEQELLTIISRVNANERKRLGPLLSGRHKNWHAASKNFSESAVREIKHFPIVIVRPSSICPAWKEPEPGFNDSKNAIAGVILGVYKGLVRRIRSDVIVDQIPVDIAANVVITAAWKTASERQDEVKIYQAVCGDNVANMRNLLEQMKYIRDYPSTTAVWYPNVRIIKHPCAFKFGFWLYQWMPSLAFDLMRQINGKPSSVRNSQRKFYELMEAASQHNANKFRFGNKNMLQLYDQLSKEEKDIFYMDVGQINWPIYNQHMMHAIRRFLLNESEDTVTAARRKSQYLRMLNVLTEFWFYFTIWAIVAFVSEIPMLYLVWLPPVLCLMASFLF